MWLFEFFIRTLGSWSKWVAFAGSVLVCLALAGVAGELLVPLSRGASPLALWGAATALLSSLAILAGMPLLGLDPLGRSMFPPPMIPAPAGIIAVSAAYAAWYAWAPRGLVRAARGRSKAPPP